MDADTLIEDELYWYEHGDCHTLALAIRRLTGWQLAALGEQQDHACGGHAFVVTPTGHALDIRGARSVDQLLRQWHDSSWCHHTVETIEREFGEPYEPQAAAHADDVAARLVAGVEQLGHAG